MPCLTPYGDRISGKWKTRTPWCVCLRAFQNPPWNGCSATHRVEGTARVDVAAPAFTFVVFSPCSGHHAGWTVELVTTLAGNLGSLESDQHGLPREDDGMF